MKSVTYLFAVLTILFAVPFAHAAATLQLTTEHAQACPYSTVQVLGHITNAGSAQEDVTITSTSEWVKIAPDVVSLSPGQKATVYIYITPENGENDPGLYTLPISVKSASAKKAVTKNIQFTLMSCHHVALQPKQTVYNACITENAPILFDITNQGKTADTFAVTSSLGDLTNSQVTLRSGETKTIKLTVPVEEQEKQIVLKAASTTTYAKATTSLTLYGDQCYTAEIDVTPKQAQLCVEDGAVYTVQVRNTGSRNDTFTLKANSGKFANNTLAVKAGGVASTTLKVNPTVTGEHDVEITAQSAHTTLNAEATLAVSTCRGVAVSIAPQEETVCYGDKATYEVTVKNTGTKKDTYVLTTDAGTLAKETVELNAGQVSSIALTADTKKLSNGTYAINVKAESKAGAKDSAKASYTVDYCAAADIQFEQNKDTLEVCPGDVIENTVRVKNTGRKEDTYTVRVSDGTLREKNVVILAPGVSRNVTWTIPTEKDAIGEDRFTLTMKGSSKTEEKELAVTYKEKDECFGFTLTAEPVVQRIESYQKYGRALYSIIIANRGERSSTYTLSLDGPNWSYVDPKSITVSGKGRGTTYVYMAPPYKINEGVYEATVHATSSQGITKSTTLRLVFGGDQIEAPEQKKEDIPLAQKPKRETAQESRQETYTPAVDDSTFLISERKDGSATVRYTTAQNKTRTHDITFRVGSFIMEIAGEKLEYENVTDGQHKYQIRSGSTVYRVLVDVKRLATKGEAYNVSVLDVEVIENAPNTEEYQTKELSISSRETLPRVLIILAVAVALIVLVLFWPNIHRKFTASKKAKNTHKEDDEEKEEKKKGKKKDERKNVKTDINEILESI